MAMQEAGTPDDVLFEQLSGRVAKITLNTPEIRNAATPGRLVRLRKAFERAADSDDVRAIILTGAGGHFSSGGNVKGFSGREPTQAISDVRAAQAMLRQVLQGDKPVVAAVEGYAAGAGVGMACMCDIVVADPGAKFFLSFSRIGMVPDLGLHFTLGQRVGQARARRLLLLAETVVIAEAERIGLVDIVAPESQAQETALKVAQQLAAGPRSAIASLRRGFYVAAAALDAVLEYEAAAMTVALTGNEIKEGVAAFLEKRSAVFP